MHLVCNPHPLTQPVDICIAATEDSSKTEAELGVKTLSLVVSEGVSTRLAAEPPPTPDWPPLIPVWLPPMPVLPLPMRAPVPAPGPMPVLPVPMPVSGPARAPAPPPVPTPAPVPAPVPAHTCYRISQAVWKVHHVKARVDTPRELAHKGSSSGEVLTSASSMVVVVVVVSMVVLAAHASASTGARVGATHA